MSNKPLLDRIWHNLMWGIRKPRSRRPSAAPLVRQRLSFFGTAWVVKRVV